LYELPLPAIGTPAIWPAIASPALFDFSAAVFLGFFASRFDRF
jgi:hypothetical protein